MPRPKHSPITHGVEFEYTCNCSQSRDTEALCELASGPTAATAQIGPRSLRVMAELVPLDTPPECLHFSQIALEEFPYGRPRSWIIQTRSFNSSSPPLMPNCEQ
jgi:hypothetical protein